MGTKSKVFRFTLGIVLTMLGFGYANAGVVTVDPSSRVDTGTWVYYYYGHENKSTTLLTPGTNGSHNRSHTGGINSQTTFDLQQLAPNTLDYSLGMNHSVPYGGWARSYSTVNFSVDSDATYDLSGHYNANGNRSNQLRAYLFDVTNNTYVFDQSGIGTVSENGSLSAGDYRLYIYSLVNSNGIYSWNGVGFGSVAGGADVGSGNFNFSVVASVPEPQVLFLFTFALLGLLAGRRIRAV